MVAKKKKSEKIEDMSLETIREEILKKSKAGEELSEKSILEVAEKNHLSEEDEESLFDWIQEQNIDLIADDVEEIEFGENAKFQTKNLLMNFKKSVDRRYFVRYLERDRSGGNCAPKI